MPVSLSIIIYLCLNYRNYDFIHFHEPFPLGSLGGILPFSRKQRVFVTWHSEIIKQKALKGLVGFFQRILVSKASAVTATSPMMVRYSPILKRVAGKIKVIPLSIDISRYRDNGGALPRGLSSGEYILNLGRLSYYKGISVLLEAYRESKVDMPLAIAGQGSETKIVRAFISGNPSLKIFFIDTFVDENQKMHLLSNCAFFVLPSIHATEAFAITQLEAMIFSKPVLNTSLPTGVPWVSIDGLTGMTVSPGDSAAMAKAIRQLAVSRELREKYGNAARSRVLRKFNDQIIKQELLKLYGDSLV
jgi:glycosyltransferase involved in cell wall biosynthesis